MRIRKILNFRGCYIAAIFHLNMASAVQTSIQHSFEFITGLRGFHVYKNTENWKPFVGQEISFKRELSNSFDRFAVAGKVLLLNKLAPVVVGHIPRELSRHTWYAILNGALITGKVENEKAKASPLVQGGLEIIIRLKVQWSDEKSLNIFKVKVNEVAYPVNQEYTDDSKNILDEVLEGFRNLQVNSGDESSEDEEIECIDS